MAARFFFHGKSSEHTCQSCKADASYQSDDGRWWCSEICRANYVLLHEMKENAHGR